MNTGASDFNYRECVRTGFFAGLIGGLAEIFWVLGYSSIGAAEARAVAAGITTTLIPDLPVAEWAIWLGVGIHLALGAAIGVAFNTALRLFHPGNPGSLILGCVAAAFGAGIWAINFLVLLPWLNPAFVSLLPYSVSLASKLLFGLGLAAGLIVLRRGELHLHARVLVRQ